MQPRNLVENKMIDMIFDNYNMDRKQERKMMMSKSNACSKYIHMTTLTGQDNVKFYVQSILLS